MANELVVRIVGDSKSVERALARSTKATQKFQLSMGSMARGARGTFATLGASFTAAGLAAAFVSTINKAADFERSLDVLQAVSGATAEQMKRVSAVATQLGADITLPATSAKDAAEAMLELSKGGLSVETTMAAARGTLQLAAAAHISAAEAAQIQARQLNAFNLEGNEAIRVADVLANVAASATGDINDFAIAFQQSSSVANQFGLSIEQTAASLGVLANNALVGSDAGTSLRTMLTRLVPSTKKAQDEMRRLGISWKDAHGNITPFRDLLEQYHDALTRLSPAQRQLAVQTIFGQDAQRAANIIFGDSVGVYDRMVRAVSRQGGAARQAAAQNKGFAGAIDALKSGIETLQIKLGTVLLPELTKVVTQFNLWLSDTKNQKVLIDDLTASVQTFAAAVKTAADTVATLRSAWEKFANAREKIRDKVPFGEFFFDPTIFHRMSFNAAKDLIETFSDAGKKAGEGYTLGFNTAVREKLDQMRRITDKLPRTAGPSRAVTRDTGDPGESRRDRIARLAGIRIAGVDAKLRRQLDRLQDLGLRKQLQGLRAIAAEVRGRLSVTKDATRRLTLEDQLLGIYREQRSVQEQITDQIKTANAALKERADAIKGAVLEKLQRRQTSILNQRAIAEAKEQLRIARQLGGGITAAKQRLADARFEQTQARLEAAPARLTAGGRFQFGGVVININGITDPEAVANRVAAVLKKRQKHTTSQSRGPAAAHA